MQWRRGLLLAGIHLVVAVPLIVWQEKTDWPYLRTEEIPQPSQTVRLADTPDEQTVSFSPCGWIEDPPLPVVLVKSADLPATVVSGWRWECPFSWSLAGRLGQTWTWNTRRTEMKIAAGLCALIPIQWFLVGGFPVIRPRQWWLEPGAFITLCAIAAFALVLIPALDWLSQLPALLALLAWWCWFFILTWKILRVGWRLAWRATVYIRQHHFAHR